MKQNGGGTLHCIGTAATVFLHCSDQHVVQQQSIAGGALGLLEINGLQLPWGSQEHSSSAAYF